MAAPRCPENSPVYCEKDTLSRGLCVPSAEDCNSRINSPRNIPILNVNPLGARYGYLNSPDIGKHCYYTNETMPLNYSATFEGEEVPANFSCLTYNIWGLAKNKDFQRLFNLRKPLLERTIDTLDADMLCLQEMSSYSYENLRDVFSKYKFASEVPYPPNAVAKRNRGADVYFLSKYRPSGIYIYGLQGVLGYSNALMVVEYPNLLVFNLYSQAGSKASPGQSEKWLHYSRCRYDILQSVYDLIASKFSGARQVIICGDFNFDLDGNNETWPEMEMIDRFKADGFIDSFRKANPMDPGFTEDTNLNKMRWNYKLTEKLYRYDAILYKGPLKVKKSEVIGLEEACMSREDSEWFMDKFSGITPDRVSELKMCGDNQLPINPSDHFGVLSTFGPRTGGSRKTRKRLTNLSLKR